MDLDLLVMPVVEHIILFEDYLGLAKEVQCVNHFVKLLTVYLERRLNLKKVNNGLDLETRKEFVLLDLP